jgi:hypothetical protein
MQYSYTYMISSNHTVIAQLHMVYLSHRIYVMTNNQKGKQVVEIQFDDQTFTHKYT